MAKKYKEITGAILVPGLLSTPRVFQHQLENLHDVIDMQVIHLNDVNSPTAMAEKILKAAPSRFVLIGHSIGGWVALKIMKMAPERVTKLCVLNTSAKGIDEIELTARQAVLDRVARGEFQSVAKEIADRFVFNKEVRDAVLGMFLQAGETALIQQTQAMMAREDLRDLLPKIDCPTLVIHADQDQRFSLNDLMEISNAIPKATLKIVSQCGHMSPMEQPEQITQLLRDWMK